MAAEQEDDEPDNLGFDPAVVFGAQGQLNEIKHRMYSLGLADAMRNRLGAIIDGMNASEAQSTGIALTVADCALIVRALETYGDAVVSRRPMRMWVFSPDAGR